LITEIEINRDKAQRELFKGYMIFAVGMIVGYYFANNHELSPFLIAYVIWATFWGYKMLYKKLKSSNLESPVKLSTTSTSQHFKQTLKYKVAFEIFTLVTCYIVGVMGGGIYMQIKLSYKAYFE
jgi:hypothetical protein